VSYLGTLEERKNTLGVLKIAEQLKERSDIHFIVAGRGDSEYANRVEEQASRLYNVTYLGEINDKEKTLLIRSTYVNILMSHLEALGLTQLEFMYAGVPIVTSGAGGQAWLVRNGREGIHTHGPDDAEGAANAILSLVNDHETWTKLSTNAREKARTFTSSKMIRELDEAITKEIIKENGLKQLPPEARRTFAEAENVLKTWSAGSWGAVATETRLFIKKGRLSRKVAEIPYSKMSFIEHTRRYPWKIVMAGLLPALTLLLEPLWRAILKDTFISTMEKILTSVTTTIDLSTQTLTILLAFVPMLIGSIIFALQARTGFNLHGLETKPLYIPHKFGEVVTFIRNVQDKQQNAAGNVRALEKTANDHIQSPAESHAEINR